MPPNPRQFLYPAPPEALNNFMKRIGFRSFAHYRIRVLLYAGQPNWGVLATAIPR